MSHTAQQENLEPTITVRQALRQQQDLLANCFLWKIRIAVQQRNSCPRAGGRSIPAAAWLSLSCRRIALTRGLPLAVLMSSLPLAATVQSFPPGWVLWGVWSQWHLECSGLCVVLLSGAGAVVYKPNLLLQCSFWRAVSTALTDKGAAWKMRSVELPSEAGAQPGSSIPWSFHPLNLTAAQLGAAVPLCLSIHLHVKQHMIAGNCTILSSSSRILLIILLNQAFPHCCRGAGRCSALSDFKLALAFWESVKIWGDTWPKLIFSISFQLLSIPLCSQPSLAVLDLWGAKPWCKSW